jgi:diguanylate cyclase (GGDEF)-like protein
VLFIFLAAVGVLILPAAYAFFQMTYQKSALEKKLNNISAELQIAVSTEKKLQDEIQALTTKLESTSADSITNLLTRKEFEDRVKQNIEASARYQYIMGVAYLDIDNFSRINQALGEVVGNLLLNQVSLRLQSCVRQVDSISRFSKDTFVILLAQLAKPETAAIAAQRMLQALAEPFQVDGNQINITVEMGIAFSPLDAKDTPGILRCAEQALHIAKENGKHTYQFYQEKMQVQSQRELALYTALSRKSFFEEFSLLYQPIFNVESEAVVAMDALLYWQHPVLGLISPGEIFHYAEKQRNLNQITEWMLRNACKQFLSWRSLGYNPESIGVKIAIDNFGAASLSLRYLKSINITYLKLDQSFVDDIVHNERTASLLKSLCVLASNMSMQVIVKGVESDEQVDLLKQIDCILMQGRRFGEPLPEQDVISTMTASAS